MLIDEIIYVVVVFVVVSLPPNYPRGFFVLYIFTLRQPSKVKCKIDFFGNFHLSKDAPWFMGLRRYV